MKNKKMIIRVLSDKIKSQDNIIRDRSKEIMIYEEKISKMQEEIYLFKKAIEEKDMMIREIRSGSADPSEFMAETMRAHDQLKKDFVIIQGLLEREFGESRAHRMFKSAVLEASNEQ